MLLFRSTHEAGSDGSRICSCMIGGGSTGLRSASWTVSNIEACEEKTTFVFELTFLFRPRESFAPLWALTHGQGVGIARDQHCQWAFDNLCSQSERAQRPLPYLVSLKSCEDSSATLKSVINDTVGAVKDRIPGRKFLEEELNGAQVV